MNPSTPAWQVAGAAARESYGRLLAWLAVQWRDVEAAEDALSEAFVAALETWPRDGVPDAPDAWLLTAARRRLLQAHRHRKVVDAHAALERVLDDGGSELSTDEPDGIPDQRLALMFACTHPAIDAGIRSALMLQTVLGLEVAEMAAVFLLSPATLAQRLVRAKRKLRVAGIRFGIPEPEHRAERAHAVLEAIYAAYGLGWESTGVDDAPHALTGESIFLARLTASLLPDSAEAAGLLALILFCEARAPARIDGEGGFVPLHLQDTRRWDRGLLREAERTLWRAAALRRPGAFQLEAAIQSAHAQRAYAGAAPWSAIATLYAQLVAMSPTIGLEVAGAVAVGESQGPVAGVAALETLARRDPQRISSYQPYWAALGHLLAKLPWRWPEACVAYRRAIGLTVSPVLRTFLENRMANVNATQDAAVSSQPAP